jgi:hypothetical protein
VEGWRRYGEAGAARGRERREVELAIDRTHFELVGGSAFQNLILTKKIRDLVEFQKKW